MGGARPGHAGLARLGLLLLLAICSGFGCSYPICAMECFDHVSISTKSPLPDRFVAEVRFDATVASAECIRSESGGYTTVSRAPDFVCLSDGIELTASATRIEVRLTAYDGTVLADTEVAPFYIAEDTCGQTCLAGKAEIELTPTS